MTLNTKNKHQGQAAPASINLQDLLVKASQDAEIAKSAVREVFIQALKKRKESIVGLEMPDNTDEAPGDSGNGRTRKIMNELESEKRRMARKTTNNGRATRNGLTEPASESTEPIDRLIEAVSLAREKIRMSREEAETYKKNAQAAVAALEDKEVKMREKSKAIKQQLLISIREAQARAQKAQDEAKAVSRETWAVVKRDKIENRKMIEDAQMELIKAREAARRAKKEAELAISRVNDTMMKVQQEIIGITINEMGEAGQDLIEVAKSPDRPAEPHADARNTDRNQHLVKLERLIQLWQQIQQTARDIFRSIKDRFYPRGV
jgi:hypothetical protein